MQERSDAGIAGGGLEGPASEQAGVPALAEDQIRSERSSEEQDAPPTAPGMTDPSGPLPEEPDPSGTE
ncbi:MAG TPA: hypothetical protein VD813_02485 [Pseudonocardia sp.]|nr:hypothetical protein [Pseudonocardia sp.]